MGTSSTNRMSFWLPSPGIPTPRQPLGRSAMPSPYRDSTTFGSRQPSFREPIVISRLWLSGWMSTRSACRCRPGGTQSLQNYPGSAWRTMTATTKTSTHRLRHPRPHRSLVPRRHMGLPLRGDPSTTCSGRPRRPQLLRPRAVRSSISTTTTTHRHPSHVQPRRATRISLA